MSQKLQKVDGQPNLYLNLASGIYWVRVMIDGRDKWRSTRCTTLKAAIAAMRTLLGGLEESRGKSSPKVPTLAQWWAVYTHENRKAPLTVKREESIMRLHVLPQYGDFLLTQITKSDIQRWVDWRRHKAKEGTVKHELSVFAKVLQANVDAEKGVLRRNPARDIVTETVPPKMRVITPEEQAKLESVMPPAVKRYFLFLLGTGIRAAEARGLREAHIDWEGGEFMVTGKGAKARWVPFIPDAREALQRLLREQLAENSTLWASDTDGMRWAFEKAGKGAQVDPFGAHTLRHTFATRYLTGGGDIYILSKILGHASVAVTEMVYAHLKPRDLAARSAGVKMGISYGVVGKVVGTNSGVPGAEVKSLGEQPLRTVGKSS